MNAEQEKIFNDYVGGRPEPHLRSLITRILSATPSRGEGLLVWAKDHYWDSLEAQKDIILLHLRSFTPSTPSPQATDEKRGNKSTCTCCGGVIYGKPVDPDAPEPQASEGVEADAKAWAEKEYPRIREVLGHAIGDTIIRAATNGFLAGAARPARSVDRIAADAIDMFIEYRDKHGKPEQDARICAVNEMEEGAAATADLIARGEIATRPARKGMTDKDLRPIVEKVIAVHAHYKQEGQVWSVAWFTARAVRDEMERPEVVMSFTGEAAPDGGEDVEGAVDRLYHENFLLTEDNDGERDREHYEIWVAGARAAINYFYKKTERKEMTMQRWKLDSMGQMVTEPDGDWVAYKDVHDKMEKPEIVMPDEYVEGGGGMEETEDERRFGRGWNECLKRIRALNAPTTKGE